MSREDQKKQIQEHYDAGRISKEGYELAMKQLEKKENE